MVGLAADAANLAHQTGPPASGRTSVAFIEPDLLPTGTVNGSSLSLCQLIAFAVVVGHLGSCHCLSC